MAITTTFILIIANSIQQKDVAKIVYNRFAINEL